MKKRKYLPATEAAKLVGISASALRSRGRRGTWNTKQHPSGITLFEVPIDDVKGTETKEEAKTTPTSKPPKTEKWVHPPKGHTEDRYYFDGTRYIFLLRSQRRVFPVEKDVIERFVSAYSNYNGGKTINEIAMEMGWPRHTVIEIKTILGKTHDSSPFTDEQLVRDSEEDLYKDLARVKENRIIVKAEREEWKRIKKLAEEYDRFDKFVHARLKSLAVFDPVQPLVKLEKVRTKHVRNKAKLSVVMSPTDFHAHKYSWKEETGQESNYLISEARLERMVKRALDEVMARKGGQEIAEFIVGVGSDLFHIDTYNGSTTKGTPQDVDGTWARVFVESAKLFRRYVATLAQIAPVTLVNQKGNHDANSTVALWELMKIVSEFDETITCVGDLQPVQWLHRGKTLIGLTHGDGMSDDKLAKQAAVQRPALFAECPYRYVLRGHYHTFSIMENPISWVIGMPSLAGTDRWHTAHGYTGNRKALGAYLFDHDHGLVAAIPVYDDDPGVAK